MATEDTKLRVEMFGGFTIVNNGNRITEQAKKSSKVWRLLQYIAANHKRSVSQDELFEIFVNDDMDGNPGSVLRTMVYRARGALEKSGLDSADRLIVAKSGGYSWNNEVKCTFDIEEFEELIKKAGIEGVPKEEKVELLLKAAALYKGDFLPNSTNDMWVVPLVRWYRTLYLGCVHDALDILDELGRNTEAEELCTKALCIDSFDEQLIEHHLIALIAQGKNDEALNAYKKMETMFFDVLGVNFSDDLRALYSKLHHPASTDDMSLDEVINEWQEEANFPGAYYCDFAVFKTMFQIESRSAPRSGRVAYIVRFDTKHNPKAKDGGIMKQLGMAIPGCLRMGDLFTRSSPNQYMLMLHSLTYEDCKMLINRILRTVDSKHLHNLVGSHLKHIKPLN